MRGYLGGVENLVVVWYWLSMRLKLPYGVKSSRAPLVVQVY